MLRQINPGPCVFDRYVDTPVAYIGAKRQPPLTWGHLRHCLRRVDGKICHNLLQLDAIGEHGRQILRERERKRDAVSLKFMRQKEHRLFHHAVDADRRGFRRFVLGHRANARDDAGGALGIGNDALGERADFCDIRLGAIQPPQPRRRVGGDGGERLIDLVGNRSRKLAEHGNTCSMRELGLDLAQHGLGAHAARYVDDADQQLAIRNRFQPPDNFDCDDGVLAIPKKNRKGERREVRITLVQTHVPTIAARVARARAAGLSSIWYREVKAHDGSIELQEVTYLEAGRRVRRAFRLAGIKNMRPHDLRHHAGTALLDATGNLKLVQEQLGHVNIKSTVRYAHVKESARRAAIEQVHRNSPKATKRPANKP